MLFLGTSDRYVEQAMGTSVTQIFELRGESFFRDHEVCWSTLILELLKTSLLSFPMIYSITLQFTYHCPPKYKIYLVFRSSEFQFTFPFPLSLYSISLISGFNTRIFIDILF